MLNEMQNAFYIYTKPEILNIFGFFGCVQKVDRFFFHSFFLKLTFDIVVLAKNDFKANYGDI